MTTSANPPTAFCPRCGGSTRTVERGGLPRAACPRCRLVLWQNPKAAVAVILRDEAGRVLLVRRRGSPDGAWCIPCGNIEWDEDIRTAARREMEEETGLQVEAGEIYAVFSNFHDPEAHSVGVWFLGRVTGGRENAGGDADRLGWFDPAAPALPLAFPTDLRVLEALAANRPQA
jgi:8-oxo-dGTP diphosphatase